MERLAPAVAVQRSMRPARRTGSLSQPGLAGGLAEDGAASFQGWGSKHYHGHRERLRKRFLEGGAAAVADYELLELLLFFSVHRRDTKPIAKAMLAAFGGLGAVLAAEPGPLRRMHGRDRRRCRAGAAADARRRPAVHPGAAQGDPRPVPARAARRRYASARPSTHRRRCATYLQLAMRHEAAEHIRVLFLDRKDRLIRDEVQGRGTVDQAPLYPREVVKRALELGASAVILVHNHPSGDPTPSRADIELTRQVAAALAQVGIAVHDHLIVGGDRVESLRELGILA